MKFAPAIRPLPLLLFLLAGPLSGTPTRAQAPSGEPRTEPPTRIFHLSSVRDSNEASEILTALRNILMPSDKIYLVYSSSDIVLQAPQEDLTRAADLLAQLDRPKPTYRLVYTLTESDAGKRVGVQHFSMIAVLGRRVQLKQGDKVPVVTGSSGDKASTSTQVTYIDIGMNLDFTLDQFSNTLLLRSRVEQSSVAAAPSTAALADDPIVRQSLLEGTSVLKPGKPLILGSLDIVGSTRHVDIEVMAEPAS